MRRREFLTISAARLCHRPVYPRESRVRLSGGCERCRAFALFTAKEARVVSAACESLFLPRYEWAGC